jgi:hypothetical protein
MLTPLDILNHTYNILPKVTDKFGTFVSVGGAFVDAQQRLNVTGAFVVGRRYVITGLELLNPITAVTGSAGNWTLTTQHPHSLTAPVKTNDQRSFCLEGGAWTNSDGYPITAIPSVTTINTNANIVASPAGSTLVETLTSETGFLTCIAIVAGKGVFELNGYAYPCQCRVKSMIDTLNVEIVPDINRAEQHFEKQAQNWLYIIMGDSAVIPHKNTEAGAATNQSSGIELMTEVTEFTALVMWARDSSQEHHRKQITEAYGVMKSIMRRTYFGKWNGAYITVPSGNGQASTKTLANYAHAYDFKVTEQLERWQDGLLHEHLYFDVPIRVLDSALLIDVNDTPQPMNLNLTY